MKIKNCTITFLLLTLILGLTTSCAVDMFGPARPDIRGRRYLESKKVPPQLVTAIVKYEDIGLANFEKYSKCEDSHVRLLIAQNPYTLKKFLNELAMDKLSYVRQGVALNKSIDEEMIKKLEKEGYGDSTVIFALVGNPSVPKEKLLAIFKSNKKKYRYLLTCFARNPKCPQEIVDYIYKSNDSQAKWLLKRNHLKPSEPKTAK